MKVKSPEIFFVSREKGIADRKAVKFEKTDLLLAKHLSSFKEKVIYWLDKSKS